MSATKACGGGAEHGVDFRISRAQEREGTRVGRRTGGQESTTASLDSAGGQKNVHEIVREGARAGDGESAYLSKNG